MSPWSNRKPALGQRSNLKKHAISMSCTLEPAIWSRDTCTGQQIPCFDRCQLIITWMSNFKEVHGKPRLQCLCQPNIWSMAAMLRDSVAVSVVVVVVAVRTRPRAMPLAMITMRKSTYEFLKLFLSHMSMGLRLAALNRASRAANNKTRWLVLKFIWFEDIFWLFINLPNSVTMRL